MFIPILIFIIIIFIILHNKKSIEKFDTFSPYMGDVNQRYPFSYFKEKDDKMFRKTLEKWEKPFNCNDEGYWNAEPTGKPPLAPIVAYNTMIDVGFRDI
jgi:hypothetical protein